MPAITSPRWGILGTANIARRSFLPAMRTNGGQAVVVGSRSPERAEAWAREEGVERVADYAGVIEADDVDAVYVALPNGQHVEWTLAAARAGKAVLCEKPLGLDVADVTRLVSALPPDAPVWEAFVFPFHPQTALLASLLADLGEPVQLDSDFRFPVASSENIRLQAVGGGALYDVGCYPIRLARLLFGAEPAAAHASAVWADNGIDTSMAAVLDFPDDRLLVTSSSLQRPFSTATELIGTQGLVRVPSPFHPKPDDVVELIRDGAVVTSWRVGPDIDADTAFTHGVGHIHAVLTGVEAPRYTVVADGLGQARALDLVRAAARS